MPSYASSSLTSTRKVAFHRCLVAAAQHDVEPIAQRLLGNGHFPIELGDEPPSRALIGNARVHRIVFEQRIAGEIHLRDQPRRYRTAEQRKMNMRGAPCVVVIAPWVL